VLGRVDWKTAMVDEKGLFVERVLNRRNKYVRFLEELIRAGLIGTSTEAIPDGVVKAADGEIVAWPLRRDTLTVQPMDPRMIDDNVVTAVKALGIDNLLIVPCDNDAEAALEADRKSAAAAMLEELTRMEKEWSI
jgi:DNA-binding transcriptional regulator LsrR (DeoR family)